MGGLAPPRSVYALTSTLAPAFLFAPSISMRNCVLTLPVAASSLSLRAVSIESTSSMKRMLGWYSVAAAKSALTSFSLSPCHLEPIELALAQKKVALSCEAAALASSVLPVPGGPKSRMPFGASSSFEPLMMWLASMGHTTAS